MGVVSELVGKISLDGEGELDKAFEHFKKGIEGVKEGLLGITAAVGESLFSIYEVVNKTAEAGEEASKTAQRIGITTQQLQRLQFAAKLANVSSDELGMAMNFLNRNMFKTTQIGQPLSNVFTRFGIQIRNANGTLKPANQVLAQVADKFKHLPDGPEKSGLAMQFFGRQGAAIIPILNKGGAEIEKMGDKAEELGLVFSKDGIKASQNFQESIKELTGAFQGIRNIVGVELMPTFTEIVQQTSLWIHENKDLIKTGLLGFIKGSAIFLKQFFAVAKTVVSAMADYIRIFGGAERATKYFVGAVAILSGVSLLFGIGKMIQSVYALATAFTVADATALLIPLAIGAGIAAIFLIVDDLINFFEGNDSVTGRIVKAFKGMFPILKQWWSDFALYVYDKLTWPLQTFLSFLKDTLTLVGKLLPDKYGGNLFKAGADKIGAAQDFINLNPANSPASLTGGGGQNNVTIQAPTQITVPEGTPPQQVGNAVADGVSDGVQQHLRQAQRHTQGSFAY